MGEWKRVKLGSLIRIKHGYAFPGAGITSDDNGKVLVTPGNFNIGGGFKESGKKFFSGEFPAEYCLSSGDLIVTMTDLSKASDTLGYSAIVPSSSENQYLHNQRIGLVSVVDEIADRNFIYWLMRTPSYHQEVVAGASGTTVKHTSPSRIYDVEVSLPDLPTQRRIAAVLGALDDKIEVNRKICENLEAQAQALFKGMKRRAEESSFVQVIDILSGGTPKTSVPEYWNGGIPFFSPKDVGGLFTISTERNITDQGLANCNSILYPKGTTFVTARGTVGKVCLAGVPMAMNQSCFALASNEIDPLLVYFYTCASVDSLKSKANGSVFAAITIAEFETEKIHRLTDPEEERFVKTVRPMFDQILVRQQESRALAAMRDALLPKLMSGELAVEKVEVMTKFDDEDGKIRVSTTGA